MGVVRWMSPVFVVVLADSNKDYMSRAKIKRNYVYFSRHRDRCDQNRTSKGCEGGAEDKKTRATAQNVVL